MENQSQDDAPPKSVGSNDSNLINKWRQMLLSVHHPLVPLKLAMLLYDGGKGSFFLTINYIFRNSIFKENFQFIRMGSLFTLSNVRNGSNWSYD